MRILNPKTASIPQVLIAAGLAVLLASACGLPKPKRGPSRPAMPPSARVSGTLTYRQRIAMTPGTTIQILVSDVSRADAPAIAEKTIVTKGEQVPIAFDVPYDARRIQSNRSYSVSARILKDGKLLFTTDTRYPVITNGAPSTGMTLVLVAPAQP